MDGFVPRHDEIKSVMRMFRVRRRFICHGEARSAVAIHVAFTKLYQADTCGQAQQEMINP